MNKPKLNQTTAGVTVRYSHTDKGHWLEYDGQRTFIKRRDLALEQFNELVAYQYRRGMRVV